MRFGSLLRRYVILIKPRPRRNNHFRQTLNAMDTFRSDEPNKTVSLSRVNAAEYYMKSCRGGICRSVRRNLPVEYYAWHPEMASRFAASMSLFDAIGLSPSCLVQGYPWSAVGNGRGSVVDVGGSRGFQCVAIAQSFPDLQFVVQDLCILGAERPEPLRKGYSIMECASLSDGRKALALFHIISTLVESAARSN